MEEFGPFALLVPLSPFLMIAAIVIIPRWFKSREREQLQQTLRVALEKGQPLDPEVVASISKDIKPAATAHQDLRQGVIWLAVGLGIAIFGWLVGMEENEAIYPLIGIASIPALIGAAFIVLSVFNKNKD